MPETKGGKKALAAMKQTYGDKKGEEVYYASRNLGKVPEGHAEQARQFRAAVRKQHKR